MTGASVSNCVLNSQIELTTQLQTANKEQNMVLSAEIRALSKAVWPAQNRQNHNAIGQRERDS